MKKTVLMVLGLLVVLGSLGFATAAEQSISSSLEVNEYVSVTITPCAASFSFGSGNPGDNDVGVSCQGSSTAAVNIKNDAISNKNIKVETKATDFSNNGSSITVSNAEFDEAYAKSSATTMTTSYQTSTSSLSPGNTAGIWYWLDIPSSKGAGTYYGTIYVKGA